MRPTLLLRCLALACLGGPAAGVLAQAVPDTVRPAVTPPAASPDPEASVERVRQRIGTLRGRRVQRVIQPVIIIVPQAGAAAAAAPPALATPRPDVGAVRTPLVLPGAQLGPGAQRGRHPDAPVTPSDRTPATPVADPSRPARLAAPRLPTPPAPLPAAQIAPEAVVREVERVLLDVGLLRAVGIHFAFDRADLFEGEDRTLDAVGDVLTRHPELRLAIGGHTDAVGPEAYNLALSEARAATVRRYLVERWNVAPERLTAQGYGEADPVASNAGETGRALNRRVEFRVVE